MWNIFVHNAKQWLSQFFVLLWKNLKLKCKSKKTLFAELFAPILFFMLWVSFMAITLDLDGRMSSTNVINPLTNYAKSDKKLLYGPTNVAEVESIMGRLAQDSLASNLSSSSSLLGFSTYSLLTDYYLNNSDNTFAGLWFSNSDFSNLSQIEYSISMDNFDFVPTDENNEMANSATKDYIKTGFSSLQVAVDSALMKFFGNIDEVDLSIEAEGFKGAAPLWKQWSRSGGFGQAGAIFFLIALFASPFRMMTNRVLEKEKKIRELMRMGGLRTGTETAAWWVTVLLVASGPIIGVLFIFMALQIYHFSSMGYVILLYLATLVSLIALAQLVSVFVNKAKFAGILGLLIVLVLGAIGVAISVEGESINWSLQLFLCIFSPTGFVIGNGIIFRLEDRMLGLTASQYNGDSGIRDIVGLLCFDAILYTILSWYIDLVLPGEYGTARHPLFCFKLKYWRSFFAETRDFNSVESDGKFNNNNDIEEVSEKLHGKEAVVMRNVKKEFGSNGMKKVAVNGLTLTLYEDQITAFLGHNGAGKTTTISMLTGLIPPTSGEAYINGMSISEEMSQIRSSLILGVCPQANVLWDEFSVQDHLYIHAGLKGVALQDIRQTIDTMILDLGLEEKRHVPSSALSGGQKRKLQLAISFIGNSKVIFLDECTSGMDPVTRRSVWDFLNKYKAGKAIVLTTHFMDEADILGDRIVVVSHGKVRCAGSSLFLKSRFGVGYLLTMVKTPTCRLDVIDQLVKSHVEGAAQLSDFGAEVSYRLPSKDLPKFSHLFTELDQSQQALGIDSYGISLTTLEEVFLRIGMEEKEKEDAAQAAIDMIHKNDDKSTKALNNKPLANHSFSKQVRALLIKRLHSSPRDSRTLFFSICVPLLFFVLAIVVGKVVPMNPSFLAQHVDPLPLSGFPANEFVALSGSDMFSGSNFVTVPSNTSMENYYKHVQDYAAGIEFQNVDIAESVQLAYKIHFNTSFTHALPTTIHAIHNIQHYFCLYIPFVLLFDFLVYNALRMLTNNTIGISTTILPFEHVMTAGEAAVSTSNPDNVIYVALLVMASFAMLMGGLCMPLAQEKCLNIKRLMLVSGASKLAYWISAFIWDLAVYFAFTILVLILMACVGMKGFTGEAWGVAFFMFLLHGFSALTLSYVFTLRIKSHSTAMAQILAIQYLPSFFFISGYASIAINSALEPSEGLETATSINAKVFCALSPNFNLGYTVLTLLDFVSPKPRGDGSWFQFDVLGFSALMFVVHGCFWWSLLMFLEYRSSLKNSKNYKSNMFQEIAPSDEDIDVTNERQRVDVQSDDVIIVRGMRKVYPVGKKDVKVAVANMSLGIPMGQCFGLLGMNGAGKSTTLGVLSGDIAPTTGDVYLNGYNLLTDPRDALRYFGWCPQFDALIDTLTGREQLTLYARIKGIDESLVTETVNAFLEILDMEYLADRLAGGYSGGNKRKLSMAIAMLGNPPLVFLDEPSTGMDPLSKRLMWKVITQLGNNKAIVVTTHYMEECEALCSRIGIMSQGRLMCLGSAQHLKSRFATGYTLQIKARPGCAERVQEHIMTVFPTATVTDAHDDMLTFQLAHNDAPNDAGEMSARRNAWEAQAHASNAHASSGGADAGGRIAHVFAVLVDMAELAYDFAVSQTTLEQVFLKLAKERENKQVD